MLIQEEFIWILPYSWGLKLWGWQFFSIWWERQFEDAPECLEEGSSDHKNVMYPTQKHGSSAVFFWEGVGEGTAG